MYKFLIILTCCGPSNSQNFFFVKKYIENSSEGHYYCITNSSFGLSWINEDNTENTILQKGSTFISNSRIDFDWNLEDYLKPSFWSQENSLQGKINEVILDRRWENMKVIQTQPLSRNFSNLTNYTVAAKDRKDDFVIPFSVRSNTVDIIFVLESGKKTFGPKLYWINLQVGNETDAILRPCTSLYIASRFCDTSENQLKTKLSPSNEKWSHFEIRKHNNLLMLTRITGSGHKEIIKYNETHVSSIRSMVIGGFQKKNVLLKIHNLEYMYTTNKTETIQFGAAINVDDHSICISMFISMCRSCILKLTLLTKDNNESHILEEKMYHYQKLGWTEIKFIGNHVRNRRVFLTISTVNNSTDEGFWAIDQIRQCRENELRMITSSERAKCQLISDDDGIISIEEEPRSSSKLSTSSISEKFSTDNCSESAISSFCIPCSWIFSDTCGRLRICENYIKGKKCYDSECKCGELIIETAFTRKFSVTEVTNAPSPPPQSSQIATTVMTVLGIIIFLAILASIMLYRFKRSYSRSNKDGSTVPLTHSTIRRNDGKEESLCKDGMDIKTFKNYIKNSIKNDYLKEEYTMIFQNATAVHYEEIYERLCFIDMPFANGIIKKAYVVTKVPEQNKIDHFWKTIWDQNVKYIVLIDDIYSRRTGGNYWTKKNKNLQCDNISVQAYLTECFADYEYRKFILVNKEQNIKYVDQLRLISWSDKKPLNFLNLVPFFQIMSTIPFNESSPILVHCRNGIEGASFALLCDMCLRIARNENTINFPKICKKLSYYLTKFMIGSVERYITAHLVILEILLHIETSVKCEGFNTTRKTSIDQKELEDQKCYLKEVQWHDEIMAAMKPKNNSHYFRISTSPVTSRTYQTLPNTLKINVVDGFRYPGKFIVTQTPGLKNTSNFWRLIAEKNITAIVSLNEISAQDFDFRPSDKQPLIKPSRNVFVKYERRCDLGFFDWVTVQLQKPDGETLENQHVDIISIKHWPSSTTCPPDTYNFVKFCAESERISRESSSVVVTCSDGITASGLYVAMMYNMEKMKQEQVCDVCTSVRNVRFYCPQFVKQEEQFDFLWEAAMTYMQEFRLYDNFNQ